MANVFAYFLFNVSNISANRIHLWKWYSLGLCTCIIFTNCHSLSMDCTVHILYAPFFFQFALTFASVIVCSRLSVLIHGYVTFTMRFGQTLVAIIECLLIFPNSSFVVRQQTASGEWTKPCVWKFWVCFVKKTTSTAISNLWNL